MESEPRQTIDSKMQRNFNDSGDRTASVLINTTTDKLTSQAWTQRLTLAVLLIIIGTLVCISHFPTLRSQALTFDDQQYLVNNPLVQNPSWTSIERFFAEVLKPSTVGGYYQPLTMISLMIDHALGGRIHNLLPFHRTSLLLHVCNTALIVILLYLLFGQPWIAAGVGLLFGIHPMTVEPIAWVSDRKTVLASFFALWSLVLYVRFVRTGKAGAIWFCLAMYVLALMSKPTSISLPVLMLLIDYWPLRRLNRAAVFEKLPLFVVGIVFAIIIYISQSRTAGAVLPNQYGAWRIFLVVCHNIVFYLRKILWPANLSQYYPFPQQMTLSNPEILTGVIGTCILVPLLVISLRWTRAAITGWLFFFLAILPTMQIIGFSDVIASDKYVYLPSVGFLMLLAWLSALLKAKTTARRAVVPSAMLTMCVLVIAGVEVVGTRRCIKHWRNTIILNKYMLTLSPNVASIHNNLGVALVESDGDLTDAKLCFRRAVEIYPQSARYHDNLGYVLAKTGEPMAALKHLREAVRLNRNYLPALQKLAWIMATHPDPAIRHADESLLIAKRASQLTNHRSAAALDALAAAWAANGLFEQATATAEKALWVTSMTSEKELASRITERLDLYKQGKPYREDPAELEMGTDTDVSQEEMKAINENLKETVL